MKTNSQGGSPVKTISKIISQSPSKNSPAKLALRLTSMKMTMESHFSKSPTKLNLKKIAIKEEIKEEDFLLLKEALKTTDLQSLFLSYGFLFTPFKNSHINFKVTSQKSLKESRRS